MRIKKAMLSVAAERILLVDSSKFDKVTFLKFAELATIDKLVIDNNLGEKEKTALRSAAKHTEVLFAR